MQPNKPSPVDLKLNVPYRDPSDYMDGKLWVDEFVTHHRDLKEINEGFDDMHVSWPRVSTGITSSRSKC